MSPPEILSAVKIAATRRTPIRIVGSQSTPSEDWGVPYVHCPLDGSEEILAEVVSQITQARLPKGLENTMVTAANLIFPNFFSGLSGFQASAGENLKQQPDRQINFSVVAGDVVGYCATKFNLNSLTPLIPVENNSRKPPVAQEAVNQFLGLILQKMVKVGVDAKVGLPTLFDLTRIPEIRTLAFFPSVHISDSQGQVGISLGFIDLEANPLFDLSSLDSGSDSNDVEFL